MFDLASTSPPPVRVTIGGTAYDVPRFLNDQLIEWVAVRQAATRKEQLAQFGDDSDARARFIGYWNPAPIDALDLMEEGVTPEGAKYVLDNRFKAAGVPDKIRSEVIASIDGATSRAIAKELLSAGRAINSIREASEDPGAKGNPTTGPAPTSGGSPTTTAGTDSSSPSTAPESTPES